MTDDPRKDSPPTVADAAPDYDEAAAHEARALLTAGTVRQRAAQLLDHALAGDLVHARVSEDRLAPAARQIAGMMREQWPDLALPFHSVWRRFEAGEQDRFAELAGYRQWSDVREMGRAAFDMALVAAHIGCVAAPEWSYAEGTTDERYAGAEGLAVASLAMIASGLFSGVPLDPLRADAGQLARLSEAELAAGLQVAPGNALSDVGARALSLRRLGEATALRDDLFAREDDPRPGGLFDVLFEDGLGGPVEADRILDLLIDGLGPISAGGLQLGGVPLGDTYRHEVLSDGAADDTAGLLPLLTRMQRIVADLTEPLVWAGTEVVGLERLAGRSDAVSVGLMIDTGVLHPLNLDVAGELAEVSHPGIVELRGVTIALLDRLADLVRAEFGSDAAEMPLAGVLEGGIRYAAKKIALEKRGTTLPPLRFAGAGTLL